MGGRRAWSNGLAWSPGLLLAGLGGCAALQPADQPASTGLARLVGEGKAPAGDPSPLPDLEAPPEPGSLAEAAARDSAVSLLALHDRGAGGPPSIPPSAQASPEARQPSAGVGPDIEAPATAEAPFVGPVAPPDVVLDLRIEQSSRELAGLVRERATSDASFSAAVALAALEPFHPGVTARWLEVAGPGLSPPEVQTLRVAAWLVAALGATGGDPAKAAEALETASDELAGALPIRIGEAALCTRVYGFGQYEPVEGNIFQAMRPQRVIVYTELDRFAYRPLAEAKVSGHRPGPGDQWVVELTQELQLYNESGAMSAWSRPAMPILETSRTRRRDFHIVDEIELPPNLSIGIYHLKVTVTDKATGARDTRNIGLRIVADPALARHGE